MTSGSNAHLFKTRLSRSASGFEINLRKRQRRMFSKSSAENVSLHDSTILSQYLDEEMIWRKYLTLLVHSSSLVLSTIQRVRYSLFCSKVSITWENQFYKKKTFPNGMFDDLTLVFNKVNKTFFRMRELNIFILYLNDLCDQCYLPFYLSFCLLCSSRCIFNILFPQPSPL